MLYTDHPPSTQPSASSRLFWRTTLGAVLAVAVLAITAAAAPRDAGGAIPKDLAGLDGQGLATVKAAAMVMAVADPPTDGLDPAGFDAAIETATAEADQAYWDGAWFAAEQQRLEYEAWLAAERAAAEAAAEAQRAASRYSASGPSEAQWAALRNCESSGNYGAVSSTGAYRGAYQFSQQTWNSVASRHHPWLVGVDPAAASPADQDAQARALYAMAGPGQWPHCGRNL